MLMLPIIATALLFATASAVGYLEEKTTTSGGLCDASVTQHSGYYKIDSPNSTDKNYFYWMFESRIAPKEAPFILWMTGGPGCSGMLALLNENGPCTIERDVLGFKEVNNTNSWTNAANVLWIGKL
jgi:carboxypeptidase C (cathepsin A)